MDLDTVEHLIRLVDESSVTQLEFQDDELSIRISKAGASAAGPVSLTKPSAKKNPKQLFRSPMVGSFYRSSSEEDAPFVNEGDPVKKGQPLCVIEAMKMLNMVESDRVGIIKEILVDAGQAVEFGQPLFVIID